MISVFSKPNKTCHFRIKMFKIIIFCNHSISSMITNELNLFISYIFNFMPLLKCIIVLFSDWSKVKIEDSGKFNSYLYETKWKRWPFSISMSCIYCKYMNYLNNDLSFRPSFHKSCMEPDGKCSFLTFMLKRLSPVIFKEKSYIIFVNLSRILRNLPHKYVIWVPSSWQEGKTITDNWTQIYCPID